MGRKLKKEGKKDKRKIYTLDKHYSRESDISKAKSVGLYKDYTVN